MGATRALKDVTSETDQGCYVTWPKHRPEARRSEHLTCPKNTTAIATT